MQYFKKIIASVLAICLCFSLAVIPSAAADDTQMYLYNGMELPAIPEWDTDTYPYVFIVRTWVDFFYAVVTQKPAYIFNGYSGDCIGWENPSLRIIYKNGMWEEWYENGGAVDITLDDGDCLWSNHPLEKDGVLYLSASTPIPVGGSSGSGFDGEATSILSAILSGVTQNNNLLGAMSTIFDNINDYVVKCYLKLVQIEVNTGNLLSVLTPSAEETALKENVKDTTKEITDSLFAEDAPTKVTASDVKDVAQIGVAASSMFDSGVSVGSFFDAFNTVTLVSFFSQEVYDDLHSVSSPAVVSDNDDANSVVDHYNNNLNKIKKFVGGE